MNDDIRSLLARTLDLLASRLPHDPEADALADEIVGRLGPETCQYVTGHDDPCANAATRTVWFSGTENYSAGEIRCCEPCSWLAAGMCNPEYIHSCECCGALLPIN